MASKSRRYTTRLHREIFQSLNLHIAPWIQCAKLAGFTQCLSPITRGEDSALIVED